MRKRNPGQWLALAGNLVFSAGLLLNGFELISRSCFRIFVILGVLIELAALFLILKKEDAPADE